MRSHNTGNRACTLYPFPKQGLWAPALLTSPCQRGRQQAPTEKKRCIDPNKKENIFHNTFSIRSRTIACSPKRNTILPPARSGGEKTQQTSDVFPNQPMPKQEPEPLCRLFTALNRCFSDLLSTPPSFRSVVITLSDHIPLFSPVKCRTLARHC